MTDPSWISDIVKQVYHSAQQKRFGLYDSPLGRTDWQVNLQVPETPGRTVYPDDLDVTAYRILGTDPGFEWHVPQDVPQSAIRANLQSFTDGFDIFFPDDAIRSYMCTKLALPAFNNLMGDFGMSYMETIIQGLPRPHELVKLTPGEEGNCSFRRSLEHDFNSAGNFFSKPIDTPERVRHDRKVLSNDDLHFSYVYSQHRPELWVGFLVWQNIISRYAHEMGMLHYSEDPSQQRINSPQSKFLFFVDGSANDNNISFQTLLLPHILGRAIQRDRIFNDTLAPEDIVDGVLLARANGVFRRKVTSLFGTRRITCPFGNAGTRWLTQNLHGTNDLADTSLVSCYKKVLAEKDRNPQVQAYCKAVSEALKKVIAEYEGLPELVQAGSIAPSLPLSSPAAHGEIPVKCPYHQALG